MAFRMPSQGLVKVSERSSTALRLGVNVGQCQYIIQDDVLWPTRHPADDDRSESNSGALHAPGLTYLELAFAKVRTSKSAACVAAAAMDCCRGRGRRRWRIAILMGCTCRLSLDVGQQQLMVVVVGETRTIDQKFDAM